MSDETGTGMQDGSTHCWLCDGALDDKGECTNPDCIQSSTKLGDAKEQIRRDLEARTREQDQQQKDQRDPTTPARSDPRAGQTGASSGLAAGMAGLFESLTAQFGPQPGQLGADGRPLETPESAEVRAERKLREREDKLTPEQRDAFRRLRQDKEAGVPPTAAQQRAAQQDRKSVV